MRHVLQNIRLQDMALIDHLIDIAGHSFNKAVVTSTFVSLGPGYTPYDRVQLVLDPSTGLGDIIQQMLNHTLAKLDADLLTQLKEEPSFKALTVANKSWRQVCEVNRLISLVCLRTMDNMLHFNICSIHSSYLSNNDPRVQQKFQIAQDKGYITSALIYACSHWAFHVHFAPSNDHLTSIVISFLEKHAFHWLEIISLIGQDLSTILSNLKPLKVSKHSQSRL